LRASGRLSIRLEDMMAYLQRVRFRRETSLIPSLIIRFTRGELVMRALPRSISQQQGALIAYLKRSLRRTSGRALAIRSRYAASPARCRASGIDGTQAAAR